MGVKESNRSFGIADDFRELSIARLREDLEFHIVAIGWDGTQGDGFRISTIDLQFRIVTNGGFDGRFLVLFGGRGMED